MLRNFLIVAVSLLWAANAVTIGPVGDLVINNKGIAPDGFLRPSTLAGDTFPGPVIVGKKGDRFRINVTNHLTDPSMYRATTVHWHGIFQNGTNWADGGAMVSQCPIVQNASFLYDFNVFDQAGTFWYHSHYSVQYCDGLRGAFIVYDPQDPYKYLYDVDDVAVQHPAQPVTTLINGLGRTSAKDVNNTNTPLAVVSVTEGKRYRFRIIGLSCDSPYNFTIHNHNFTIIETDGEYTAPLVVDSLWVYAGQRYSVVMNADQPVNNYWIRADPLSTRQTPGFDGGRNSAILRYSGAPAKEPTTNAISKHPLNEVNLHNRNQKKPPGERGLGRADIVIPIRQRYHEDTQLFDVNNVTFRPPTVPVLLQILNGTYDVDHLMPKGSIYKLKANSSVELQIYGLSRGGPHPYHLHGHAFYVVKEPYSTTFNWDDPVYRDTINTGLDSNLTAPGSSIAYEAHNPDKAYE
ncbi:hypothetical protein C0995_006331 [Termitomyces sp. Mi166|nr:hypothetical protein C0995_006331 [Termitomyces sp. Mi166\